MRNCIKPYKTLYPTCSIDRKSCNPEQIYFWEQLESAVDENGNPFYFKARKQSAHINQTYKVDCGGNYGLILEYLTNKREFRICIYIADSTQSNVWNNLLANRERIANELALD